MAVTVLRAVMLDGTGTPAARVSAARGLLELAFKGAELADLEERLAAIEAQLAASDNGNAGRLRRLP